MFYEAVFRKFNEKGVEYVVVGGFALNLHGVPRATADLDLSIAINESNLKRIVEALKDLDFKPRVPVKIDDFAVPGNLEKWHVEKNMQVFTFWNSKKPYEEIDIFVHNPIDFNVLSQMKEVVAAGEIQIPIVSIDHLI